MPSEPATTASAHRLLSLVRARPATLGPGRLICIDGPAGAGKTTLAATMAELEPAAVVLHTDEMLAGWHGLRGLASTVRALLAPLAQGGPGRWRRWDWVASDWAEEHTVPPGGVLVLEGCGSWSPLIAPWVGALAWVDADPQVRRDRALARDGDDFAPHWDQWARDEAVVFGRDQTRAHADLVLATAPDGAGALGWSGE